MKPPFAILLFLQAGVWATTTSSRSRGVKPIIRNRNPVIDSTPSASTPSPIPPPSITGKNITAEEGIVKAQGLPCKKFGTRMCVNWDPEIYVWCNGREYVQYPCLLFSCTNGFC